MTRTSDLHIIDDFYSDPDEMRKIALNSEFDEDGRRISYAHADHVDATSGGTIKPGSIESNRHRGH